MWIRSVTAHAFGDITEKTLHFHDGLNIVVGANGTGKSTWHAAIYAALYGLPPANTSAVDRRQANRRPRRGGGWSVSSTLILDDGRAIEIAQNLLEPGDSTAVEASTRVDVSEEIRQPGGGLDGTPWLGLDRRLFAATAWMEQAYGLLALPDDTSGQALRRAVATGAGAEAVRPAVDRVTRHRQRVVGDAADVHSPYGQAVTRLHAAETARAEERSFADRRGHAQSTVDSARRHVADTERRLNAAKYAQGRTDVETLEAELAQARRDQAERATADSFEQAVADARTRHQEALAAFDELESQAAPADPPPAWWRDQRLRGYTAAGVLVVGLVVFGASANTDFLPGIAGGGVTAGAALALGAWTALLRGGRRAGAGNVESLAVSSPVSGQPQVVDGSMETLPAHSATGNVVHTDDDWDASSKHRRDEQSPYTQAQSIADLEQRLNEARQRLAELEPPTPMYGSSSETSMSYASPSTAIDTDHVFGAWGLSGATNPLDGLSPDTPAGGYAPSQPEPALVAAQADRDRAAAAEAEALLALHDIETSLLAVAPKAAMYDAARAECDRLRRIDALLAATVSRLDAAWAAVHHNAAAELEFHLRDWLCDVTGGRYTSVRIDPDSLDVFVAGPDDPEVDAFEDSHGTSELVRLLLRLALFLRARGSERGPLVLDDVLAHLDSERAAALVDVLAKVAKHKHQVILFTTHEPTAGAEVARLTGTRDDPIMLR